VALRGHACAVIRIGETALAGWGGGFELSDPEKPPLEHGLTATEGRSGRHIHCRMDWTGVQGTLWQLSREKSLIAKRSEMKGNSGHTSKANFGSDICEFESSMPSQPVRSLQFVFWWCEEPPTFPRVRDLPTFRDAYRRRRCIIPVDGFFERKAIKGQKAKQPYARLSRYPANDGYAPGSYVSGLQGGGRWIEGPCRKERRC
jgi:hypothetical protein